MGNPTEPDADQIITEADVEEGSFIDDGPQNDLVEGGE